LIEKDDRLYEHYRDWDGYWLYCKPGFEFVEMECGTCREDTVAEVLRVYKSGIRKVEG